MYDRVPNRTTRERRLLPSEIPTQLSQAFASAPMRRGIRFEVRSNGRTFINFSCTGDRPSRRA